MINSEGEEISDHETAIQAPKRRKIGRAKAGKFDLLLQEDAEDVAAAEGPLPAGDEDPAEAEEEADAGEEAGEGEEGEGDQAHPKRIRASRAKPLTVVDPTKTKMSDLANPRDVLQGRTSSRFAADQVKAGNKKVARKLQRDKMKRREERRLQGLPEEVEEDGDEENMAKAPDSPPGTRPGTPRLDKGKGLERDIFSRGAALLRGGDSDDDSVVGGYGERVTRYNDDGDEIDSEEEEEDDDDDGGALMVETQYAPQMRLVDGQMVLDDASLEVDRATDVS